eukprot:m.27715 g.27715  ORF g.27715 m.27715 type:complete len:272 (+) comp11700_c0_seq2:55-870(+)
MRHSDMLGKFLWELVPNIAVRCVKWRALEHFVASSCHVDSQLFSRPRPKTTRKAITMTGPIVVLGSSGSVGSSTLKALADKFPKYKVRAAVRDPASEKAKGLPQGNIELVAGDMSQPETLPSLLEGASVVFIVTPGDADRAQLATNAIEAAQRAKIPFVVVSVLTAETETIFGKQFTQIEAAAKKSPVHYTILRLPIFIENNFASVESVKTQSTIYGPAKPWVVFTPVSVKEVGEAAATILTHPKKHANKTYRLTTQGTPTCDWPLLFPLP